MKTSLIARASIVFALVTVYCACSYGSKLAQASEEGDVQAILAALRSGDDVNSISSGSSPLFLAASNNHPQAVDALLEAGAKPDIANSDTGFTPLMGAVEYPEVESKLLAAGATVNEKARAGATALYFAISKEQTQTVQLLIQSGENVNEKAEGDAPLLLAVEVGSPEIVRTLVSAGASPSGQLGDRVTPLSMAQFKHDGRVLQSLGIPGS